MRTHSVVRRSRRALLGLAAALAVVAAAPAYGQEDAGSWAHRLDDEGAPVLKTFAQGGAASDGTYLYVAGGLQEASFNQVWRFDPAANRWTELEPLMVEGAVYEVVDNTLVHLDGHLYCMGGYRFDTGSVSDLILDYDIAAGSWSVSPRRLPTPRMQHGAAALGNRVILAGGLDAGFNPTDTSDTFTPAANPANAAVAVSAALPVGANHLTMGAASGRAFAMGGFNVFGLITDALYEFVPGTGGSADAWVARASMQDGAGVSMPRYQMRAFGLQNRLYVTGGVSDNGTENTTLEYDPANDAWALRAGMVTERAYHAAAAIGDQAFVAAGSGVYTVEEFTAPVFTPDPPANTAPVAEAGDDFSAEATSGDGASVTLDGSGTDADGDTLTYSWSGPFGVATGAQPTVTLPIGSHELTLTVSDGTDSDTDKVMVTVTDSKGPAFTSLKASPDTLWSPNKEMRQVTVSATASDEGDAAPQIEIIGVNCNQSANGDWQITGAMTVNLRAQRDNGNDRVYTICVRATDSSGNVTTSTVNVMVPHSQGNGGADAADAKKGKK